MRNLKLRNENQGDKQQGTGERMHFSGSADLNYAREISWLTCSAARYNFVYIFYYHKIYIAVASQVLSARFIKTLELVVVFSLCFITFAVRKIDLWQEYAK